MDASPLNRPTIEYIELLCDDTKYKINDNDELIYLILHYSEQQIFAIHSISS